MMTIFVAVSVTDNNRDGYLYWVRYGLLNVDGHVLLDVHGVRPVNGDFDGVRYMFLDGVWDVLLNGVRCWHGYLDGVGHWFFNVHRYWAVDWDLDGVGNGLFYGVRYEFLNWVRHRLGNVHGVRPVDGHLNGVGHFLVDRVGGGYMNGHLHWVGHLLLNWVRSWYMDLYRYVHLLLNWVRFRYVDLDGNRPVYRDVDGVGDLLLNRVRLRHMHGHFDDLLDWVRNVLYYGVGLRNGYLNWYGNLLLNGVRDVLFYWVWDWDLLDNSDGLVDIGVSTVTTLIAATVTALESTVTATVA